MRRRVLRSSKSGSARPSSAIHSSATAWGLDGIERFVSTPELQNEGSIASDPLPPGQVFAIGPGGHHEATSLYRIEGQRGARWWCPDSQPSPTRPVSRERLARRTESVCSARDLVGDRNPREHEFVVQLRSFDSGKSGANLGVAVLIALCSALLGRSPKGGLAIVGWPQSR
jgi:ATP-dependent Lon protease